MFSIGLKISFYLYNKAGSGLKTNLWSSLLVLSHLLKHCNVIVGPGNLISNGSHSFFTIFWCQWQRYSPVYKKNKKVLIYKKMPILKVALQILGRKFYKGTKKSSLYSQSLLIFIHRTQVVERHPITRGIRDCYGPGRHQQETRSIFTWAARSFTHWKYTDEASNIAFDEDIMENNYMFLMLWNLRLISHWIFPQCFFFISSAKSKINLKGYEAF